MRVYDGELVLVIKKFKKANKPKWFHPVTKLVVLLIYVTEWYEDPWDGGWDERERLVGRYEFHTKRQAKNFIPQAVENHYNSLYS